MTRQEASVLDLLGTVLDSIKISDERNRKQGMCWSMYHDQDCCEDVRIEEVHGDLEDLLHTPILLAEECKSRLDEDSTGRNYDDSYTWTFYRFVTIKGSVQIRWLGESNGYYSESVSFYKNSLHCRD